MIAIGDKFSSHVAAGMLVFLCPLIAHYQFAWQMNKSKRTFWYCSLQVEKIKENKTFKTITLLFSILVLVFVGMYLNKNGSKFSSMDTVKTSLALFSCAVELISLIRYNSSYHSNLRDNRKLYKVIPAGHFKFMYSSGNFLNNLRIISLVKKANKGVRTEKLRHMEEYTDIDWNLVNDLQEEDFADLCEAF